MTPRTPPGATRRGRRALGAAVAIAVVLLATRVAFAASLAVSPSHLGAAAFPVSSTSTTFGASADTWGDSTNPTTNYSGATTMQVVAGTYFFGLFGIARGRSFVRFDLSSIPAGASIVSATLSLRLATAPSASRTYDATRVTGAWTEAGLTWNTMPAVAGAATASTATGVTNGVLLAWNVAPDVQAFVSGSATNEGWQVSDANEAQAGWVPWSGTFSTRTDPTAANRPTLAVTYLQ